MTDSFNLITLLEGGQATKKFGTRRVTQADIEPAVQFVAVALGITPEEVYSRLVGSSERLLAGDIADSGDLDIIFPYSQLDEIHTKMLSAVDQQGTYYPGPRVGSYAIPVNDASIQVDFNYVSDDEWAKFIYHSEMGRDSRYKSAVRNILLAAAQQFTQVPGEDVIVREDDRVVVKAARSIYLPVGCRRVFKVAKFNAKTGKTNKTLAKVTPEDVQAELDRRGITDTFSPEVDVITDPDLVVSSLFKGAKASDAMSAEDVIDLIRERPDASEIIEAAKVELARSGYAIPSELE
jgi:hypothetical protein